MTSGERSRLMAVLALRTLAFAGMQAVFALGFALAGSGSPWEDAIAWWPIGASLVGVLNLVVLVRLARARGRSLPQLLGGRRDTWKRDVGWLLAAMLVIGPIAVGPNVLLGAALFDDPAVPGALMFRPLPLWAAGLAIVAFPLAVALTELPTYYAWVMPRLQQVTGRRWWPLLLAAGWHAAQHAALPLVFDWRFVVWRLLMFLPFTVFVAWMIDRRRSLLPYLMGVHALLDVQLPIYVLLSSLGRPAF